MESCVSVADASEGQITGIDNFSFGMVGGQEGGEEEEEVPTSS